MYFVSRSLTKSMFVTWILHTTCKICIPKHKILIPADGRILVTLPLSLGEFSRIFIDYHSINLFLSLEIFIRFFKYLTVIIRLFKAFNLFLLVIFSGTRQLNIIEISNSFDLQIRTLVRSGFARFICAIYLVIVLLYGNC